MNPFRPVRLFRIASVFPLVMLCACQPRPTATQSTHSATTPQSAAKSEPTPAIAAAPKTSYANKKCETRQRDPQGGVEHFVLEGVALTAKTTQRLDLMYSSVVGYTFIPESVAQALGAETVGEIDLTPPPPPAQVNWGPLLGQPATSQPQPNAGPPPAPALDVPAHLKIVYGMNKTGQTKFRIVRIDRVDLGVGPPLGPVTALVSNDENSAFGVLGNEWLQTRIGKAGFVHAAVGGGCPHGALYFGEFAPP